MSTLNVSNITDGTTTVGTSYVVNGAAKAWVNFNGTGTVAIRDSQGVSGLVDNGTGDHNVNFTSSMDNGNYSIGGVSAHTSRYSVHFVTGSDRATGSVRTRPLYASNLYGGGTVHDASDTCLHIFGDLA